MAKKEKEVVVEVDWLKIILILSGFVIGFLLVVWFVV